MKISELLSFFYRFDYYSLDTESNEKYTITNVPLIDSSGKFDCIRSCNALGGQLPGLEEVDQSRNRSRQFFLSKNREKFEFIVDVEYNFENKEWYWSQIGKIVEKRFWQEFDNYTMPLIQYHNPTMNDYLSINVAGPSAPHYGKTEYHFDGHVGHSSSDRTNLRGYFICQNSHNRSKPIFDNFRNMEKICENECNAIPDAVNLNELKEFRNTNLNRLRMEFHDLWRLWIP